ncbi:MAG: hypothetical protein ACLGPL_12485 [Acidobacteriota bacterium]
MRPFKSWVSALALTSMLTLAACNGFMGESSGPPPNPVMASSQPDSEPGGSPSQPPPAAGAPHPQFLDFPDIPIPAELEIQSKDSYVFQAGGFKTGVLTLRGRVDANSVLNFFQVAMPREGWKAKGGFRYRRSMLIFDKGDKSCIINVYEKMYYTYVEIAVAPANGQI